MADVLIINAKTGEVVERDFTAEEVAQREADAAAHAAAEAEREAVVQAKAAKRASALAKFKKLGLDDDEVAALLGDA
jgi:hypothetical protein